MITTYNYTRLQETTSDEENISNIRSPDAKIPTTLESNGARRSAQVGAYARGRLAERGFGTAGRSSAVSKISTIC